MEKKHLSERLKLNVKCVCTSHSFVSGELTSLQRAFKGKIDRDLSARMKVCMYIEGCVQRSLQKERSEEAPVPNWLAPLH